MTIPIQYDKRYKVTKEIVEKMNEMHKQGYSYDKIAEAFEVSYTTAYYWCNDKYRADRREINRKVIHPPEQKEARIKRQTSRRHELRNLPAIRNRMRIDSAINENRSKRISIVGIPIDKFIQDYKKEHCKGGIKIF